jgi:hypothetical protein
MSNSHHNLYQRLTIIRILIAVGRFFIWIGRTVSGILGRIIFILLIIPRGLFRSLFGLTAFLFNALGIFLMPIRWAKAATKRTQEQRRLAQQALHNAAEFKHNLTTISQGIGREIREEFDEIKNGAQQITGDLQHLTQKKRTRKSLTKSALGFAVLVLLIIAPLKLYADYNFLQKLKIKVSDTAQAAVGSLFSAKAAIEDEKFDQASNDFSAASANFLHAQQDLSTINDGLLALASLVPNEKAKMIGNSKYFAEAGQLTSTLGENLSLSMDAIFKRADNANLIDVLNTFLQYGKLAHKNTNNLNQVIAKIDIDGIPQEYQAQFTELRSKGEFLEKSLAELLDIAQKLTVFLGGQYDKRYLMIFQNNTEARATGGFMGSFALADFSNGKLTNLEVPDGGTYDTEGGMRVLVTAPKPLWLVNPLWHFWDSNWWPDWPTSAKKIMWFYEKSDGPTVDGVISFTPNVIIRLLEVLGPVDLTKQYGVVITADNFMDETQTIVEEKPKENADPNNHPKAIIGDLLNELIARMSKDLTKEKLIGLIGILEDSLDQKHILLYFTDDDLENKIKELGWSGQIKQTTQDYLMVVNTNIAGAKSDKEIDQRIFYSPEILPDGTVLGKLRIERQHRAKRGVDFVGFRNVNWLRIYVPAGSQIIKASGFRQLDENYFEAPDEHWTKDKDLINEEDLASIDEKTGVKIYQEAGKTVFANWSMVDPGETATIELIYRLPFKVSPKINSGVWSEFENKDLYTYTLLAQKQPGTANSSIEFNLRHVQYEAVWKYPDGYPNLDFSTDRYWATLLEEK